MSNKDAKKRAVIMKTACTALSVLFAFALLPAAACAADETFDPNALTIMGKATDLKKPYMTRIFNLYKESTGENLNILSVDDVDFEAKSLELEACGGLPDIYLHFNNADLTKLDAAENFEYLNGAEWTGELTESARAYCTDADGNLLGLPFWESSVSGCYYNKTLFDSLGLAATQTQEDFDGLCERLKKICTPICWPAKDCSWMVQFGLDPIFADEPALLEKLNSNQTTFSEIPAVRDMTEWINSAANRGWFGGNFTETGWNDISPALSSGAAAMTFIWDTWFYTDFKPAKYSVDDFALMPVFMNTAEGGTYEGGNLNMMMVNKNSPKKERALGFLGFCATPDNYNIAFEGISTVSVFKNQTTNIQSQMVTDMLDSIAEHERVSTASTKIIGYSSDSVTAAFGELFAKSRSVVECIAKLDEERIKNAKLLGVPGFDNF